MNELKIKTLKIKGKKEKNMKKNLLLQAGILGIGALALVGCSNNKANGGDTNVKPVSFEQAYDASVLSGIGLLNSNVGVNVAPVSYRVSLASVNAEATEVAPEGTEVAPDATPEVKPENGLENLSAELKQEILDNLAIAKSTLNGDSNKSEEKPSDKPEWEMMYTITQKDMEGNDIVYTFYYTEKDAALEEKNTKEEKPEATEVAPEAKPEEEEKIEKHITGIVTVGDAVYTVTGDREIEGNETSVEYKVMLDAKNYVVIENEVEGTENEYEYSKFENGKRVFKSEVEYEVNENGEVEIEFETKSPTEGKIEFSYEFKNTNGEELISVEIKKTKDQIKGEAIIKVVKTEGQEDSYEFVSYKEKGNK